MSKIRRIRDFQHTFSFSSQEEEFNIFYDRFLKSELGKIYRAVPWADMAASFGLVEAKKGPRPIFSPRGKVALMLLKHYAGCSDRKLMEGLNGNLDWQFFCGVYIGTGRLDNFKIISQVRGEMAGRLDIDTAQKALYGHWSPHIEVKSATVMDATCYESHMRYPTNVKLLWECTDWLYGLLKKTCLEEGEKMVRSRYLKWKRRYASYSKMKRKTKKKRDALTRSLLLLVEKFSSELDRIEEAHRAVFTVDQYVRRAAAKKAHGQQHALFHHGVRPEGRIVSLDRPYVRPIVRGKEKKPVEFGAKAHKFLLGGIGFIEHLSFDAFNEGIRFQRTVLAVQRLTGTRVKVAGGDAIYANNKNRRYATEEGIRTDFRRKGRPGKHEGQRKKMAAAITKERASRLEGSFGNDKEHYGLKRVRARTKKTEILWIFFGIHTANALEIGRRMAASRAKEAA